VVVPKIKTDLAESTSSVVRSEIRFPFELEVDLEVQTTIMVALGGYPDFDKGK